MLKYIVLYTNYKHNNNNKWLLISTLINNYQISYLDQKKKKKKEKKLYYVKLSFALYGLLTSNIYKLMMFDFLLTSSQVYTLSLIFLFFF